MSQIVNSFCGSECEAGEVVFAETTLIPDTPHYLGGPYVVLDLYYDRGNILVEFLLRLVKDAYPRFLERHEYCSLCIVPDIGGIMKQVPVHQADVSQRLEGSEILDENLEIHDNMAENTR